MESTSGGPVSDDVISIWAQLWDQYKAACARGTLSMLMPFFTLGTITMAIYMVYRIHRHRREENDLDQKKAHQAAEEYRHLQHRLDKMQRLLYGLLERQANGTETGSQKVSPEKAFKKIDAIARETSKNLQNIKRDFGHHAKNFEELELLLNSLHETICYAYQNQASFGTTGISLPSLEGAPGYDIADGIGSETTSEDESSASDLSDIDTSVQDNQEANKNTPAEATSEPIVPLAYAYIAGGGAATETSHSSAGSAVGVEHKDCVPSMSCEDRELGNFSKSDLSINESDNCGDSESDKTGVCMGCNSSTESKISDDLLNTNKTESCRCNWANGDQSCRSDQISVDTNFSIKHRRNILSSDNFEE